MHISCLIKSPLASSLSLLQEVAAVVGGAAKEEEEVKSEGLEITSFGSLYKGPWEKKYWSSSRFFGFKNSFVQRLLRELVADINGTGERSVLSSSFCYEASNTKHYNQNADACSYPDLQPLLQRTPVTKKRSRKHEVTNMKPVGRNGFKKPRSPNEMNHKLGSSVPPSSSKGRNDFHKIQGLLQPSVHFNSKTSVEKKANFSARDGYPTESIDFSGHLAEGSVVASEVTNYFIEEERPLDRSKNFCFLEAKADEAGDAAVLKDSQCVENANLCAPDTLDFMQDNNKPSSPTTHDKSNYSLKEDFTTANNANK